MGGDEFYRSAVLKKSLKLHIYNYHLLYLVIYYTFAPFINMLMKKLVLLFTFACVLLSMITVSCRSRKQAVAHKSSKPKFIDNVYIAPHNKNNATTDAIDPRKPAERSKPGEKPRQTTVLKANLTTQPASLYPPGKMDKVSPPNVVRKKYSEMLGIPPKDITNFSLYQFIDKWYGTDYRLGGSDKSGIDCSGFAQRLYGEVYGIDLLRTAMEQFSNCKRIKKSKDAEEGDLVFFHVRSKRITHVGIYLANNYFVHASTSNGVMISNLNEEYWHKYYAGCGRVPKGG